MTRRPASSCRLACPANRRGEKGRDEQATAGGGWAHGFVRLGFDSGRAAAESLSGRRASAVSI